MAQGAATETGAVPEDRAPRGHQRKRVRQDPPAPKAKRARYTAKQKAWALGIVDEWKGDTSEAVPAIDEVPGFEKVSAPDLVWEPPETRQTNSIVIH